MGGTKEAPDRPPDGPASLTGSGPRHSKSQMSPEAGREASTGLPPHVNPSGEFSVAVNRLLRAAPPRKPRLRPSPTVSLDMQVRLASKLGLEKSRRQQQTKKVIDGQVISGENPDAIGGELHRDEGSMGGEETGMSLEEGGRRGHTGGTKTRQRNNRIKQMKRGRGEDTEEGVERVGAVCYVCHLPLARTCECTVEAVALERWVAIVDLFNAMRCLSCWQS